MKRKFLLAIVAATLILGGCGKETSEQSGAVEFETVEQAQQSEDAQQADAQEQAEAGDAIESDATDSNASGSDATAEDYTEAIKEEVRAAASDSLSDELQSINDIYNKYDDLRMNAEDQTSINILSQWGTVVWKEETVSLLERIKEKDPSNYGDLSSEYEKWESYVPSMAEKMSETYKDGSIYPMIYSYNEAMRYKQEAYTLASTLADLAGDVAFSFPDSTACGYYGDYAGDSYLIIAEGMESGSYEVTIHIDDAKQLHGWATTYEYPGEQEVLLFTSDDDTVKGTIDYFVLEATFYVSETDGSVVGPEESYSFTFKY